MLIFPSTIKLQHLKRKREGKLEPYKKRTYIALTENKMSNKPLQHLKRKREGKLEPYKKRTYIALTGNKMSNRRLRNIFYQSGSKSNGRKTSLTTKKCQNNEKNTPERRNLREEKKSGYRKNL
ncbi:MAG: hypothetical protein D3922_08135 [Candidatus Electrothrix sp. AR1]|nr:hypothetical protein [Candidatus Electrothrix sp. AR1]